MSDRYFVDTNILMYAHDTAAGEKHRRAKALIEELWRDRSGVVSTQVLQELAVNLRKKARRPLDNKATREIVADYLTWQVVVNGGESGASFDARVIRLCIKKADILGNRAGEKLVVLHHTGDSIAITRVA